MSKDIRFKVYEFAGIELNDQFEHFAPDANAVQEWIVEEIKKFFRDWADDFKLEIEEETVSIAEAAFTVAITYTKYGESESITYQYLILN